MERTPSVNALRQAGQANGSSPRREEPIPLRYAAAESGGRTSAVSDSTDAEAGIQPGTRLTSVRFAMRIRDGRPFRRLRRFLGGVESTVSAPAFGNPRAGRSAPGDQWAPNAAARCFFSFALREPIECQE